MTRLLFPFAMMAGCVMGDNEPPVPTYDVSVTWTTEARSPGHDNDSVAVGVVVYDLAGTRLDGTRIDGYDGQAQFALATDLESVRVCAQLQYWTYETTDDPFCPDCPPETSKNYYTLSETYCHELALDASALDTSFILRYWSAP